MQLQLQLNQDLGILHQDDGSSKNKRGVLPKHATNVMRSWLFQHIGVRTEHDQESQFLCNSFMWSLMILLHKEGELILFSVV